MADDDGDSGCLGCLIWLILIVVAVGVLRYVWFWAFRSMPPIQR